MLSMVQSSAPYGTEYCSSSRRCDPNVQLGYQNGLLDYLQIGMFLLHILPINRSVTDV